MRAWASRTSRGCSGIGRGSGFDGSSQASVQALRSCRAGFPVSDLDRTVSLEDALKNFCLTTGWVSASSVVSQTEPVHTPCAPSASAAVT
jgi:hypothetical protein